MAGDLWSETPEQMKKGFPRCGGKPQPVKEATLHRSEVASSSR